MATTYPLPQNWQAAASMHAEEYTRLYQESLRDPEGFWARQAELRLRWLEPWHTVRHWEPEQARLRWFDGATLNVSDNCLDRHLEHQGDKTALIWEADEPEQGYSLTYRELHEQVCRLANVLLRLNVQPGDRVCLYLPMIPQAVAAMLACTRIGAVHSVVFGGFSSEALRERINNAQATILITANEARRGGRRQPLKAHVDEALANTPGIRHCLVVQHTDTSVPMVAGRDLDLGTMMAESSPQCPARPMAAEDPLFILYTSGSTGKPKGVLHTTAGYLLYVTTTFQTVFDHQPNDIFWCTADIGWVTGHSYVVYGVLANGGTSVLYEGVPTYPDASRMWRTVDRHGITILYTAPTAIRALMGAGDQYLAATSRKSLRLLGSVGEPINPEAWEWYYHKVGEGRCPIVDTWWQTETGGIMLSPLPGSTTLKPGAAAKPFFGIEPALLDDGGKEVEGAGAGNLVLKSPWPGMMRTVFGDHQRFIETYFSRFPGCYNTGDGAQRDADGDYWITGRTDDVINVSGHRIGTAEVESALVRHPRVAEAAVVPYPHAIKGQGIYAYVTPISGTTPDDNLKKELIALVTREISPIARPDIVQWATDLPKTRSGKIMRRILRKIASGDVAELGDTSTLADPEVIERLLEDRHHTAD